MLDDVKHIILRVLVLPQDVMRRADNVCLCRWGRGTAQDEGEQVL